MTGVVGWDMEKAIDVAGAQLRGLLMPVVWVLGGAE